MLIWAVDDGGGGDDGREAVGVNKVRQLILTIIFWKLFCKIVYFLLNIYVQIENDLNNVFE